MRLTLVIERVPSPENLLGYRFIIKGKGIGGEDLLCLS